MASSDVQICNLALSRVAQASIASLTETSPPARQCRVHYEPARDTVLRAFDWPFARARVALANVGLGLVTEWAYRYQLPADCLAVRRVGPFDRHAAPVPFETEGATVLTDLSEATLVYTQRITDSTRFDPLFADALAWRLAMDLALPLKVDRALRSEAAQGYQTAISAAEAAAANEADFRPAYMPATIQARG
jgi:hypothetical protein